MDIAENLGLGATEVLFRRFMLNEHKPWPEEIDEAVLAVDVTDWLFEGRYAAATNPKYLKEFALEHNM